MVAQKFQNPLFIDIECASIVKSYEELSPPFQRFWKKKALRLGFETAEAQEAAFYERAAIYAEFGQVITIALGYIDASQGTPLLHVRGLVADNEKSLLSQFRKVLEAFPPHVQLCGHNIKEFDIPYLCRRMTVHQIPLPPALDVSGKKPWEVNHIDTMELWKFGDYKSYTSLDVLAHLFGLPSSKQQIDGSQVNAYFYEKQDLATIKKYCMQDVVVTAQVFRHLKQQSPLDPSAIQLKD